MTNVKIPWLVTKVSLWRRRRRRRTYGTIRLSRCAAGKNLHNFGNSAIPLVVEKCPSDKPELTIMLDNRQNVTATFKTYVWHNHSDFGWRLVWRPVACSPNMWRHCLPRRLPHLQLKSKTLFVLISLGGGKNWTSVKVIQMVYMLRFQYTLFLLIGTSLVSVKKIGDNTLNLVYKRSGYKSQYWNFGQNKRHPVLKFFS